MKNPTDTTTPSKAAAVALNRTDLHREPLAFLIREREHSRKGELAKVLASSFLKYSARSIELSAQDSVDSFIELNRLCRELTGEAEHFLQQEIRFILENQPLEQLLLAFASHRLNQASRTYYYETLMSGASSAAAYQLKATVLERQQDLDNLLQSL
jgi:hypothetical protein